MAVEYRPVLEAEIPETVDLFLASLVDMYARMGLNAPPPPRVSVETNYRHIYRTGIFDVALVDGRIAAIGHAVVRDRLWFLSGFWARPGLQGRGIGGPLLKRVWQKGEQEGARTFFTWSSVDPQAMASYMKMGMLPGYQLLTLAGTPSELPKDSAGVEVRPLSVETAAGVDRLVRDATREVDHRFWLEETGHTGFEVMQEGRTVGYFYSNQGKVGPAAWTEPRAAQALLETAFREASRDGHEVRLMIPGVNHDALRFAFARGLRLAGYSHLLTSAPFGRMEQYLSSGPSLF